MKVKVSNINPELRQSIRNAVALAVTYWPNSGDTDTPREMIRRAFQRLRYQHAGEFDRLRRCVNDLSNEAYAHADM
jgi:hypothetical protein